LLLQGVHYLAYKRDVAEQSLVEHLEDDHHMIILEGGLSSNGRRVLSMEDTHGYPKV
jgi:hypothetical protein